jgi:hypothetical protein
MDAVAACYQQNQTAMNTLTRAVHNHDLFSAQLPGIIKSGIAPTKAHA